MMATMQIPKAVREFLRKQAVKGGNARRDALTPERRREIARKAVAAREAKRK
jgi:hypothetical protein